ncbi:MAG: type II secretion system protein M [Azonexus sp.]|jgi:MSHA biogenesis protein MshJ|nr:type II secretion system protein M [Azonexus sp.]
MSLKAIADNFAKRSLKERRLMTIAVVLVVLLFGYLLAIEPALKGTEAKKRLLTTQASELTTLQSQLPGLRARAADPDAGLKRDLADHKAQLAAVEAELLPFHALLVSPTEMPDMLRSLLSKYQRLTLERLKTPPAAPLLNTVANAAKPAATANQGIYRHPIEITVSGSYAELTAYADALQHMTPHPLWSGMTLKVIEYPRSEMTFMLYTLSLDHPLLAI